MKEYFQNLTNDIKVTFISLGHLDITTIILQWRVLRMLSINYPDGNTDEPLDELSQRRYDKQMKRLTKKICDSDFHDIDY